MSLSNVKGIFGVHSFTPYSRTNGLPFGIARVLGAINFNSSQEIIELNGGSSFDAWDAERGLRTNELTMTLREYPAWLQELLLGADITQNSAEATGDVSSAINIEGTSAIDGTTGIDDATAKSSSESEMKSGVYIVKVISPTTVDLYCMSNVDFARAPVKEYIDDSLKITTSPLTIVASSPVEIPGFGIELNGGSGAISMTIGDTASFTVRAPNSESDIIDVGGAGELFQDFGAIMVAQKKSNGELFEFNFSKIIAGGMPTNMAEKAWSEFEITLKPVRAQNVTIENNPELLYRMKRIITV